MSTALKQLSCMAGIVMALFVLVIALLRGTPMGVAFFRAVVVMCIGSVIMACFVRFFTSVLQTFLHEKLDEQRQAAAKRKGSQLKPG